MHGKRKILFLFLALLMLSLLSSCNNDKRLKDLKNYIAELRQSAIKKNTGTILADLHPAIPVVYQAKSSRSPFETSSYTGSNATLPPLQTFSLNMLRFTGTVTQNGQTKAFILAPDNKLYQVKLGDMIGDHYGKIIKVYPDRLEIEETVDQSTENLPLGTKRLVTLQLKDAS